MEVVLAVLAHLSRIALISSASKLRPPSAQVQASRQKAAAILSTRQAREERKCYVISRQKGEWQREELERTGDFSSCASNDDSQSSALAAMFWAVEAADLQAASACGHYCDELCFKDSCWLLYPSEQGGRTRLQSTADTLQTRRVHGREQIAQVVHVHSHVR